MTDKQPKPHKKTDDIPQMPFNEALKRVWAAKPSHKTAKKQPTKK
jgi:hypothetical protein